MSLSTTLFAALCVHLAWWLTVCLTFHPSVEKSVSSSWDVTVKDNNGGHSWFSHVSDNGNGNSVIQLFSHFHIRSHTQWRCQTVLTFAHRCPNNHVSVQLNQQCTPVSALFASIKQLHCHHNCSRVCFMHNATSECWIHWECDWSGLSWLAQKGSC